MGSCFIYIIQLQTEVLLSPFYRGEHWGSERLSRLPKARKWLGRDLSSGCSDSKAQALADLLHLSFPFSGNLTHLQVLILRTLPWSLLDNLQAESLRLSCLGLHLSSATLQHRHPSLLWASVSSLINWEQSQCLRVWFCEDWMRCYTERGHRALYQSYSYYYPLWNTYYVPGTLLNMLYTVCISKSHNHPRK